VRHRRLTQELLIASAVGALFAVSPLTGDDRGPAALAGAAIAGATFAIRNRRGWPTDAEAEAAPEATFAALPLLVWVALGLWLALFWPTLEWLWRTWTASVWTNNHGVFMPAIIAVLTWLTLRDDERGEPEHSAWGFAWLALAIVGVLVDSAMRTGTLGVLSLIVSLPGLALLLLGARRTRLLKVPLALGLLMVPVPPSVATSIGLRQLTAAGVEPLLHALGVPALREGTVIHLAGDANSFIVADECSGIATLYASAAVAIVLACYARTHSRRVLLLLAAAPLAIGANVARVLALILMSSQIGDWIMHTPIHPGTGVAAFAAAGFGLWLLAGRDPFGELR
jgi:exosortase